MREQPEVLEHHPHLVAADVDQIPGGLLQQILAVEPHLAVIRLDEARQAPHDGGLARAGQAHDDEDLAGMDVEAHVDDGGNGAVGAHAARELARVAGGYVSVEVGRRLAAIDLPDVAAGQLDRFGVRERVLHVVACRHRETSGHEARMAESTAPRDEGSWLRGAACPGSAGVPPAWTTAGLLPAGRLEAGSSRARFHERRGRRQAGVPFSSSDHELMAAFAASTQGPQVASLASTHSAITSSSLRPLLSISSISTFCVALSIDMTSISL